VRYRREIANWFLRKDATPGSALGAAIGGILSDGDPRFTIQRPGDYQKLSFRQLRKTLSDRFAHGAIELALVGDIDEDAAVAMVARTLGALPRREPDFLARESARHRTFTADRSPRTVIHRGEPDQALLQFTWPTTDESDPIAVQRLELLERVVQIELDEEVREKLGKAYSPSARSAPSRVWRGYGTFALSVPVDVADVEETRAAIAAVMERLASEPVGADTLERARRPLLESYDNALKGNGGWMRLAARAQSEAFRIDRFLRARDVIEGITSPELKETAARYLAPGSAVVILARPDPEVSAN
jgi:zinc protease